MLICPCNVDPLTTHFYIVILGFTRVYIIFLFLLCSEAVPTCTLNLCSEQKKEKNIACFHLEENRLFAYAKTKTQISFAVTAKLISAFVFATLIVQSLYFLDPKF